VIEETEIKLKLSSETMTLLIDHPLINDRVVGDWQTVQLYNQYFDTTNMALDQADLALRLRKDGEQVIQTLKGRGNCVGGLFVRNEKDWYIDNYELDLEVLACSCWPKELADLDKRSIVPIFTNHFTRTKALLKWLWQNQVVEVEVAFDVGSVNSADANDDICEFELEIRQGPLGALMELALELAFRFSLIPSSISKAERGYNLLKMGSKQSTNSLSLTKHHIATLDDMISTTAKILVNRFQYLIEAIYTFPDIDKLKKIKLQQVLLCEFIVSMGGRIKAPDYEQFQFLLTAVDDQIHSLLQGNLSTSDFVSACNYCFKQPTWGFLCLKLTKWYLLKEWQDLKLCEKTDYLQTHFNEWSNKNTTFNEVYSDDILVNFFTIDHNDDLQHFK